MRGVDVLAARFFKVNRAYYIHVARQADLKRTGPHTHRGFAEVMCVTEGVLIHTVNGARFEQTRGALTYVRERDVHRLQGDNFAFVNVAFPTAQLDRLAVFLGARAGLAEVRRRRPAVTAQASPEAMTRMDATIQLLLTNHASDVGSLYFMRFLAEVFVDYFLADNAPAAGPAGPLPGWLSQTLAHIEANLGEELAVPQVVRCSGRSQEHVSRTFRRFLRTSPSQYLNERRLARSATLLAQTNDPILDICLRLGFNSLSYFYRLFARRFGVTPRRYRLAHAVPGLYGQAAARGD